MPPFPLCLSTETACCPILDQETRVTLLPFRERNYTTLKSEGHCPCQLMKRYRTERRYPQGAIQVSKGRNQEAHSRNRNHVPRKRKLDLCWNHTSCNFQRPITPKDKLCLSAKDLDGARRSNFTAQEGKLKCTNGLGTHEDNSAPHKGSNRYGAAPNVNHEREINPNWRKKLQERRAGGPYRRIQK